LSAQRAGVPRWRNLAGIVASAILLGLYARGGVAWPLGFVALVPWLLALSAVRSSVGALLSGWAMCVAFVAAVFYWFGVAIGNYTGLGVLPAMLALLALAPLLQLQVLAFALARHLVGLRHGPVLRALAGASAWVACEWLLPKLLGDTLGHGLFPSTLLRQVADVGGAAGITFLLILVNEALAFAWPRLRKDGLRATVRPFALAGVVVAAMAGYGLLRLATLPSTEDDGVPSLRVAMVQASITDYERLRAEMGAYAVVRHVLDTHYALSRSAIRDHGAEALLWSETVYPTTFGHPKSADGAALDREILDFAGSAGVPLVFGTYDRDAGGEYNAAAFIEPGVGLLGSYRKTHPFPLTEHVPRWLDGPLLRRWLPWAGGWQPGAGARVLPLRTADGRAVEVVPLICLDDVRPGLTIAGARLGAQAIVGLSNDAWFSGQPNGARLHLAVAAFRSIETRLPQLRVTTNGFSAIVDETGEVLASTAIGDQAVLTGTLVARPPPPTLMVRWGDWVGGAGLLLLLGLAVVAGWRAVAVRRCAQRASAAAASTRAHSAAFATEAIVLAPVWRTASALLLGCAGLGLAWLFLGMLLGEGLQVQSLDQVRVFAALVVAPMLAAWAIRRAHAATLRIDAGWLVLDLRSRRIEIPARQVAAARMWRIPLPRSGVDLWLASGGRWPHGIALHDPVALLQALDAAGAPARLADAGPARIAALATARASGRHRWLDHPLVKFVAFPLLPALLAFRLHQQIAFGGTFGELYTYGPQAWLFGLLFWWAAWSLGLMLFAAALRIAVEAGTASCVWWRPAAAVDTRRALLGLARALFYLGVPVWLVLRVLSG
jgi:apolipoprotein N-acyltransferase